MDSKDNFRDLQFDGKPSGYRDFRRKTILAVAGQENKLAHLAGPRLLQRLQGEAWRATEHLRIADLRQPNGWIEVIHALDQHYKFLPETELHEAVEEFLFALKRRPHEGATSFSSRFRTQLDRVQTLISQEREAARSKRKKRGGKKKKDDAQAFREASAGSSLEESGESEFDLFGPAPDPAASKSATEDETGKEGSVHRETSQPPDPSPVTERVPPSSVGSKGSKRKSDGGSQKSRGTEKADRERENRRMLEMLGSLEHGHLRPKPIFPQAILGHLYMRKFGLSREQRAHIIRSTNGSSRLDDVERIIRASDLEEFRQDERSRRHDDRKPSKMMRRDTYAMQSEPQQAYVADGGHESSSSLLEPDDSESESHEALVAADPDDEDEQELQEVYEVQKKAKKDFRKNYKTYKESRKKVREIRKNRTPYLPVVALQQQQSGDGAGGSAQAPVMKQTFGYDRRNASTKPAPKKKNDSRFSGKREEANLTSTTVVEQFSYMVTSENIEEEIWLTAVPEGYAIIDTGCTTSIVGSETAETLSKFMQSQGWPAPKPCSLPPVELKGFNGGKELSTQGLQWTVKLGELWGTITTYVIAGTAPFLLSRRVLEGMQAQLDLGRITISSEKHGMQDVPLRQASNGHLLLPLVTPSSDFELDECENVSHQEPNYEPNTIENSADLPCAEQHLSTSCPEPDEVPYSEGERRRPLKKVGRITDTDRRRVLQHIVKNTRKGIVNIDRFREELITIFGKLGHDITSAFVAYKPRLERIPTEANTDHLMQSIATLTVDGEFLVQPWCQRNAGATRRRVTQVNVALFVYAPTNIEEVGIADESPKVDLKCWCCREVEQPDEEVCLDPIEPEVSTEVLYDEETDWVDMGYKPLDDKTHHKLQQSIQGLRMTYAQFIMSRLEGDQGELMGELSQWLGDQAPLLQQPIKLIEVFTGQAPLSQQVEKQCSDRCIRIGLEYGQDLNRHQDRRLLMLLIAYCRPTDVWISFPCGCWGPWSRFNMHRDEQLCEDTLAARHRARRHLSIVPEIWHFQQSLGHHAHIENPLTSDAWKELRLHNAYDVRIDQCSVGLRCPKTNNPILKPTRIVTTCREMAESLSHCRCDKKHEHAHLEGSYKGRPLTSYAETYPRKFCRRIASVIVNHQACRQQDVFAEADMEVESSELEDLLLPSASREDDQAEAEAQPEGQLMKRSKIKAMITKLHINTGHSSPEQMLRLANRCKVSEEVKQEIKAFRCAVCDDLRVPPSHRQSAMPHAETPNQIVGVDYVQVELKHEDSEGKTIESKFNILTCVDLATDFAQQIIVEKGSNQLSNAFHEVWTRPFGAPTIIYTGPASATMSADFQHYLLRHNIQLLHCSTESHWQLGRVEIANRILRGMAQKVWQCSDRPAKEVIETCASVRNQQLRKHGYSPCQWFLGHDTKHPAMLHDVEEQRNFPVQSQVLANPDFLASVKLREEAARAFIEEHSRDVWRRALASRNRPMRGPYVQGQMVYFFRKRARGLLSTRHGVWYGPGKVIGVESSSNSITPRIVWVAHNGFIYKCSPEGLRPSTEDEKQFRELARDLSQGRLDPDVEQAEQQLSNRAPQYQDLTLELPEEADDELTHDIEAEPDIDKEIRDFEEEGPRKIRRRFYRSPSYWEKRSRGMPPHGTLQEGPLPYIVGPEHTELNYEGEPPSKRRAVLDQIPEEIEMHSEGESYTPSLAPADEEPAASNVAEPPRVVIPEPLGSTDDPVPAPSDAAQDPGVAETDPNTHQDSQSRPEVSDLPPVPDDDEELMVDIGTERVRAKESVLVVSMDVVKTDITDDPLCLWAVLEECFEATTPKAKLRRVEVNYRRLNEGDKELFKKAMQKEWQSWVDNKVTSLCTKRGIASDKIIRARWVLTWKKSSDPDDRSKTPKARLVLIGWQDPDLGKIATDSPTLRKESKHLVLSICAANRWKVFGADIKTAFLSGDRSNREIYFRPPAELREWLQLSHDDLFRLEKAAYGLAEAPRAWFLRLTREMREAGLCQSQLDPCLFVLRVKNQLCGVCGIHVDDLLGGGTPAMDLILDKLRKKLPFGDYRTFTIRYTGIEIRQDPRTFEIEIGQEAYIDALESVQTKPLGNASTPLENKSLLRTCAGQLAWVSNATRPDQSFLASYLQGVQDKGFVSHVQLYNKSLRELKERRVCLKFPSTVPIEDWRVVCVCDAGWATRDNGDSQGGYLLLLAESKILTRARARSWIVDWSSKKLKRAVRSSVAAETLAGQNGLDAIEMFQALLEKTLRGITPRQFRDMTPIDEAGVVIDSKGFYDAVTRSCCSQSVSVERRLQIDYAIAKETLSKQHITPYWVNNLVMIADCLTKLKGDSKLLYDFLESGFYQIKLCTVSGRKEKAGEGATKQSK